MWLDYQKFECSLGDINFLYLNGGRNSGKTLAAIWEIISSDCPVWIILTNSYSSFRNRIAGIIKQELNNYQYEYLKINPSFRFNIDGKEKIILNNTIHRFIEDKNRYLSFRKINILIDSKNNEDIDYFLENLEGKGLGSLKIKIGQVIIIDNGMR